MHARGRRGRAARRRAPRRGRVRDRHLAGRPLAADHGGTVGSMRYGMLESVHQFAREQFARAGEQEELSRRHLTWLTGYAGQADLEGPDQGAWMDLLDTDLENIRVGLEWGLAQPGSSSALALAGLLAPFWMVRGHAGPAAAGWTRPWTGPGPGRDPRLRAIALDGAGQLAAGPVRPRRPARLPGAEPGHLARPGRRHPHRQLPGRPRRGRAHPRRVSRRPGPVHRGA